MSIDKETDCMWLVGGGEREKGNKKYGQKKSSSVQHIRIHETEGPVEFLFAPMISPSPAMFTVPKKRRRV